MLERFLWLLTGVIVFPAFIITAVFYPMWEDWRKNL